MNGSSGREDHLSVYIVPFVLFSVPNGSVPNHYHDPTIPWLAFLDEGWQRHVPLEKLTLWKLPYCWSSPV